MLTATDAEGELPEALQKLDPHIVELVCNEVVDRGAGVAWDDIAGQEAAKKLVQELVVWPMLNPHLFKVWLAWPHTSDQRSRWAASCAGICLHAQGACQSWQHLCTLHRNVQPSAMCCAMCQAPGHRHRSQCSAAAVHACQLARG